MRHLQALIQAKTEYERSQFSALSNRQSLPPMAGFVPNRGGQAQFFNLVPFTEIRDVEPRWILLRGGIGSGKSRAGAAFACSRALLDPESRGLITANSYSQLETSTLVALAEFCQDYDVPLEPSKDSADDTARVIAYRRSCKIGNAHVLVVSASKFGGTTKNSKESGRGLQCKWVWADEWLFADQSAFNTINGRLGRGKGLMRGLGVITSSPNKNNPYNWGYDFFDDPARDSEKRKLYFSINCPTRENTHLDPAYVESLETSYTPELARIELLGEYASLTSGKVFRSLSRDRNVLQAQDAIDFGYNPLEDVHLSLDFNWDPACAVAAQIRNKSELFFVREFRLTSSDTFELAEAIATWLVVEGHRRRIFVHGDASGASRSANSKLTNWQIVWNTLKSHGLFERASRRYGASNPNVLDTVLSVNNLMSASLLFICGDRCPNLIKDLEQVTWKSDGATIDKSNLELTHLSDCLRYLVYGTFPYKRQVLHQKIGQRAIAGVSP